MGATTFRTTSRGEDVSEAFSRAVDDAKYMHGHGGYTGTIAEKTSYEVIPQSEVGEADAGEYANHLIDEADPRIDSKWGPAGAILLEEDGEDEVWMFFGWASL